MSEFSLAPKVVGVKQSKKAILSGRALSVLLADDADPLLTESIEALCRQNRVAVERGHTMQELGALGDISVGAAVVTLLQA